jgi:hypothetical protein
MQVSVHAVIHLCVHVFIRISVYWIAAAPPLASPPVSVFVVINSMAGLSVQPGGLLKSCTHATCVTSMCSRTPTPSLYSEHALTHLCVHVFIRISVYCIASSPPLPFPACELYCAF